jgi:hypothetical protein
MKKQIRQNVFETNSSSTHSICVAKTAELTIPEKLHFSFGEFGWECNTLRSVEEKASYLYTGLFSCDRFKDIEYIGQILDDKGIDVTFEEVVVNKDNGFTYNTGYVDHAYELCEFLNAVCCNEETLCQFLFSPLSFIITGNDNCDPDEGIGVNYEHQYFYKGN